MYQQYKEGWIEVITGCMFAGKTEELIRVVDQELDGLRYNIKAIKDRETWTEETEGIFLRFRYEEEALQEIRTILS